MRMLALGDVVCESHAGMRACASRILDTSGHHPNDQRPVKAWSPALGQPPAGAGVATEDDRGADGQMLQQHTPFEDWGLDMTSLGSGLEAPVVVAAEPPQVASAWTVAPPAARSDPPRWILAGAPVEERRALHKRALRKLVRFVARCIATRMVVEPADTTSESEGARLPCHQCSPPPPPPQRAARTLALHATVARPL